MITAYQGHPGEGMSFRLSCPSCGSYALQPLCHLPPDPQFICDDCGDTFASDLSPCSEPVGGEGV